MCKIIAWVNAVFFLFMLSFPAQAQEVTGEIDVKQVVLSHLSDAYEWHITNWGNKELTIPLPVILRSQKRGWFFFSSALLRNNNKPYGFYIATEGIYEGRIVEKEAEQIVRPLDLSITKTVFALLFNSILLLVILFYTAACYRKRKKHDKAPKGFVGMMEMFILMIYEDVIRPCAGREYKRFAPYLLTVFFFIFLNNLMGLIPFFPGGANVTGNIAVTLVLALCTFIAVNLSAGRAYWKEIFCPDVPVWLKFPFPLMPLIELVGIFTKPFALMIRLFANMLAGHAGILALTCLIFITAKMGAAVNGTMTLATLLFGIFMNLLELLIAFIQAYVFTMLSAVFIGLARPDEATEGVSLKPIQ